MTTSGTSPRARSSCSPEGSRRSTTSASWPAETTTIPSKRTGEGRAINRHDYTSEEIEAALDRPVVRRIVDLVRLRNTHPAFDGDLVVDADNDHSIRMRWQGRGYALTLDVDFDLGTAVVTHDDRAEQVSQWVTSLGPAGV